MWAKIGSTALLLGLLLGGCGTADPVRISVDYFFRGEDYGRAGLVINVCVANSRADAPRPDSLQIRGNLRETADWAAQQGSTFEQPRAYIDAPDLIGVGEWGAVLRDAEGWERAPGGCIQRVIPRAFNAVREWDVAGACPVTSFSLRLGYGRQQLETELPCTTPLYIVFPAAQRSPPEEG